MRPQSSPASFTVAVRPPRWKGDGGTRREASRWSASYPSVPFGVALPRQVASHLGVSKDAMPWTGPGICRFAQALHAMSATSWWVRSPRGAHAVACGIREDHTVETDGHVGYYCAGMTQLATVKVHGNAGTGVAEKMMSGMVRVHGDASQSAGATAHGGPLVIDGDASARCGISMNGVDIVVGGNVGYMSALMGQARRLVVCGDAGGALYEACIFVRGTVKFLGADCMEKEMRAEHLPALAELLNRPSGRRAPLGPAATARPGSCSTSRSTTRPRSRGVQPWSPHPRPARVGDLRPRHHP